MMAESELWAVEHAIDVAKRAVLYFHGGPLAWKVYLGRLDSELGLFFWEKKL